MFLAGHLAWGYVFGRVASKWLRTDVNLALLFTLSIFPDVDFLIPCLIHHGPTHSIVLYLLVFFPLFLKYKKLVVPYFIAIGQHILGDLPYGVMLFWPVTTDWFMQVNELAQAYFESYWDFLRFSNFLEWGGFILMVVLLFKIKDLNKLLKPHLSNLMFIVISAGIIMSLFNSVFGASVPIEMWIPHLTFLVIFTLSALSCILFSFKSVWASFIGRMKKVIGKTLNMSIETGKCIEKHEYKSE